MDDLVSQARQGSVAAIIQILNQELADLGVRTRAVFSDGILQLLCEAATVQQVEQSTLVEKIREVLESLSLRQIRRVRINGRLVREQQLLWLEEIQRDPQHQLLWSQEITLKRPHPLQTLWQDLRDGLSAAKGKKNYKVPATSSRIFSQQRLFWQGIFGGLSVALLLLLGIWWWSSRQQSDLAISQTETTSTTNSQIAPSAEPTGPQQSPSTTPTTTSTATKANTDADEPFVKAVRLAEEAAQEGTQADSAAEWLDLAAKWQRASDLMAQVEPDDPRYPTAQDRKTRYKNNSKTAQQEAEKYRDTSENEPSDYE
ncbi:hypothetical protein [Geitlerinema sp. PCC 9228]|jgi:hypothetical protein|uniref:hypothetical protein n=1 Tax=Geitlerinema sp. PCC 9228 TaxID=111611 RepID=UPI001FCCE488|nr:hypothetical protein [Geitlerinema sp. PCC 9228]